jgi:capsular polysaccharide export protein
MGQALYRHKELAFCVEKGMDLDKFWTNGFVAPEPVRHRYLSWVHHECLAGGDFYAKDGMEAAIASLRMKIENALAAKAPSQDKSARIITAAFGQQAKHLNEK